MQQQARLVSALKPCKNTNLTYFVKLVQHILKDVAKWETTLHEKVLPAIVSIRTMLVRTFDTDVSSSGQATGFIVDAEQGIVLTNRHVVKSGPLIAEGILNNSKEEVKLIPIYRDPVHDFGFFKFNTASVKFQQLKAISLRPEEARIGIDVRVVGNDSGER